MSKLAIPFLLIVLLGLQYRLWIGDGGLMVIHSYKRQADVLTGIVEKVEAENLKMSVQIDHMRHSLDAIESLARYDLGMIKKNEEFFLFDRK